MHERLTARISNHTSDFLGKSGGLEIGLASGHGCRSLRLQPKRQQSWRNSPEDVNTPILSLTRAPSTTEPFIARSVSGRPAKPRSVWRSSSTTSLQLTISTTRTASLSTSRTRTARWSCASAPSAAHPSLDDKQRRIRVIVPNVTGRDAGVMPATYHAFYEPSSGSPALDDGRPVYPSLRPGFVWPESS